ncbi:MAG: alpha/beta fold hydrolase [Opitutaceae bacterium]|jgi:haloalkane dehalogenase
MQTTIPDWLKEIYPFVTKTLRTKGGARMSYVDEGPRSEEAVVMVHGNPTWSFYYRNLIRRISPAMRCVAPDHIGMGLSEKPQDYSYRLETRIQDLDTLIGELGLRKVHLVVHDWGGAIGLGWAGRNPEKTGRIVLLNTAAFPSERIPARIALCRSEFPGTVLVRGLNAFAGPATWMSMNLRSLSRQEKAAYLYPYGSWKDRVAVNAFVKDIPMKAGHPSYATLKKVGENLASLKEHPIRLVWGGADFCFNRSFFKRFTEIFPNSGKHYLERAGHYVLEDAQPDAIDLAASHMRG